MQIGAISSSKGKTVGGFFTAAQYDPGNGQTKALNLPVIIIQGKEDGPKVLFVAGFNGLDIFSTYSLYRFSEKVDPKKLKGTVIILPVLNISGYYASSKIQPLDGKLLENSFPGNLEGSVSEQIAFSLMEQVVANVDLVVYLGDEEGGVATEPYAQVFGPDSMVAENDLVVQKATNLGTEIIETVDPVEGHFPVEVAEKLSIAVVKLVVGAKKGKDMSGSLGKVLDKLRNLLAKEAMTKSKAEMPDRQFVLDNFDSIYSSVGGTWESAVDLGKFVKKGELLGVLLDPENGEKQEISSSIDGKVVQLNEALRILKHDKLCTVLPILDAKESPSITKEALRVIKNGNK